MENQGILSSLSVLSYRYHTNVKYNMEFNSQVVVDKITKYELLLYNCDKTIYMRWILYI